MLPKVVIVGRPNVGKSSLLNLLAGRQISIVDPTAGVTRDRVATVVTLPPLVRGGQPHRVELIDTGGWGVQDSDNLTREVEQQIAFGVGQADLILFVIDAQAGIIPLDEEVAKLLHRTRRPDTQVMMIANKVDGPSHEAEAYEAERLGFGEVAMVSATSGYQKIGLQEAIAQRIDFERFDGSEEPDDPGIQLALVGKRNAGKSTLVNALAGDERVIVSEVEGTTRDSVDVRVEVDGHVFTAIDTAGVRKRKSVKDDIEYYSMHRSMRSIRRADVVLLLIDAALPVSQVDKQLGHEILKHHKPVVIVVNKWDLAESEYTQEQYLEYLDDALKGLSFAPIVFISALNKDGIREVLGLAHNLYQQAQHRVPTAELNKVMEAILAERTPTSSVGKRPKVYYVTQLAVEPPTIGLFVNDPTLFEGGYERFLLNRFRDTLPFSEVPIKLAIRPRKRIEKGMRDD